MKSSLKVMRMGSILFMIFLAIFLPACGGGSSGSDDGGGSPPTNGDDDRDGPTPPTSGGNWDSLVWDQGKWG